MNEVGIKCDGIDYPENIRKRYDGFAMFSYLEHLPKPNMALRQISNSLNDYAIGIVEVPNFDMILSNRLCQEFIIDHLMYFTEDTLKFALNRNGFNVLECNPIWHGYIIKAIVRKKGSLDLTLMKNKFIDATKRIEQYISQYPNKCVAVWGAGHESLMVLSQIGCLDKIKYVVDSADFKQDKFTFVSHLPIVAPSVLFNDEDIKAIIIMAGSYTSEICSNLIGKFNGNVAIIKDQSVEIVK
jgi:hypothetical protein